jgi:hypothetical protein
MTPTKRSRRTVPPLGLTSVVVTAIAVTVIGVGITFLLRRCGCLPASTNYVFPGGLNPCLKDAVQSGLAIAGILTVAATAWGVVNEMRKQQRARADQVEVEETENRIRARDLRWRQAQEAHRLLRDIHDHEWASAAVQMMDWSRATRSYSIAGQVTRPLSWSDIRRVVESPPTTVAAADIRAHAEGAVPADQWMYYVVDAFDWFLYFLDRIGHAIQTKLVREKDVLPTLQPYLDRMEIEPTPRDPNTSTAEPLFVGRLAREHSYTALRWLVDRSARASRKPPNDR